MKNKLLRLCGLLMLLSFLNHALAFREPDRPMLPNFDKRRTPELPVLDAQRQAAAQQLKSRIPAVRIDLDELLAAPKWIMNPEGYLSGPDFPDAPPLPPVPGQNPQPLLVVQAMQRDRNIPIRRFVDENLTLFGYGSEILQSARTTREFVDPQSGLRTIVWEQQLDGMPVFEATFIGHVRKGITNLTTS